jgi:CRP-like cAMP-binding protein
LAALLLPLCEDQGNKIYGYNHQNLVEAEGTYRKTTTQTLNRFKADGLIAIGHKRIDILDPEGLELISVEYRLMLN